LAGAAATPSTNDNAKVLTVSLPGPFNGCTYLDAGATSSSDAVLDMVRPSAFLTSSSAQPSGRAGPIADAELTSLKPENPSSTPSHPKRSGATASSSARATSWRGGSTRASLSSVKSDGYRAISSLDVSNGGLTVTAVFAPPTPNGTCSFATSRRKAPPPAARSATS